MIYFDVVYSVIVVRRISTANYVWITFNVNQTICFFLHPVIHLNKTISLFANDKSNERIKQEKIQIVASLCRVSVEFKRDPRFHYDIC